MTYNYDTKKHYDQVLIVGTKIRFCHTLAILNCVNKLSAQITTPLILLEALDPSLELSVTYRHETGEHYDRVFIFGGKNRFCHTLATKSCLQTFCTGYQTDNIVH